MPTPRIKEMAKANRIRNKTSLGLRLTAHAVAMTMVVVTAMLFMAACDRKPVMTHTQFKHLPPAGWLRSEPLIFRPEYDDSAATYDIALVLRHDNSYPYCNLQLVVDIVADDSTVNRRQFDVALADEYGNWSGGGFGSLYQDKVTVSTGLLPADVHSLVVWQAMGGCDTLPGVADVGIIATPR